MVLEATTQRCPEVLQIYLKRYSNTGDFLWILQNFKKTFSHWTAPLTASLVIKTQFLLPFSPQIGRMLWSVLILTFLREKCPDTRDFSGPYFPASDWMQKDTERYRKNSIFGHFSRSVIFRENTFLMLLGKSRSAIFKKYTRHITTKK